MQPTMEQVRFNKWVMQNYGDDIKIIHDDKGTVTRVNRFVYKAPEEIAFHFSGINPTKLPKGVQHMVNHWMERHCRKAGQGIWDCEAWQGESNTKVVL